MRRILCIKTIDYILNLVVGHDGNLTIDGDATKTKITDWTTVTGSGHAETL